MNRARVLLEQLQRFFLALPPARRVSFLALTAAVIGGTIALGWWVQSPAYRVLFANLGASDAGAIVEYLKAEKITYRLGDGGTSVEVPAGQVYEARLALAGRGVPQGGGVGFEIFDKQTLGMTDFVQRLNYRRALQGELARTIVELDAVEAARVHLALPERSLFVAEERRPSASVVLKLKPGRTLDPSQVQGVVNLVAASVEGLKPADVTVVDVAGQVLTQTANQAERPAGQGMLAFQREIETDYTARIESMLSRVLGPGHALARVSATLDMAQVEQTEENFDPDRVAVRNEKRARERSVTGGGTAGVPGANAVLTNDPAPAPAGNETGSEREDSALTYEISKTTSRRVVPMGAVKKLSVAVLIDGTYEGEGAARTFKPRATEEVDQYRELVKSAVGFNEERGDQIEVTSAPLQTEIVDAPEAPGMLDRVGAWSDTIWRAAGLLAIVVVALTVVRPFLLALANRAPVALAPPRPAAIPTVQRVDMPEHSRETATAIEAARANPEQTAQVIRQWLGAG